MGKRTPEQNDQLLADFRASGLKQKEFCRQRGLPERTISGLLYRNKDQSTPSEKTAPSPMPTDNESLMKQLSDIDRQIEALKKAAREITARMGEKYS